MTARYEKPTDEEVDVNYVGVDICFYGDDPTRMHQFASRFFDGIFGPDGWGFGEATERYVCMTGDLPTYEGVYRASGDIPDYGALLDRIGGGS